MNRLKLIEKQVQHAENVEEYYQPRHLFINGEKLTGTKRAGSLFDLLDKGEKLPNKTTNESSNEDTDYKNNALSFKSVSNFTPLKHLFQKVRVFKSKTRFSINFNLSLRKTNLDLVLVLQNNWMIVCHQFVLQIASGLIKEKLMEVYHDPNPSLVKIP